jgi:hypothetical protein
VPDAEELAEAGHRDLPAAAGAVHGQGGVHGLHDLAAADAQRLIGRLGAGPGTVVSGPKPRKTTQPRGTGHHRDAARIGCGGAAQARARQAGNDPTPSARSLASRPAPGRDRPQAAAAHGGQPGPDPGDRDRPAAASHRAGGRPLQHRHSCQDHCPGHNQHPVPGPRCDPHRPPLPDRGKHHSRPGATWAPTRQVGQPPRNRRRGPATAGPHRGKGWPSPAVPGIRPASSPWPPGSGETRYGTWRQVIHR